MSTEIPYRRFAELNAAQKASARKLHAATAATVAALTAQLSSFDPGDLKPVPIVDCYFKPTSATDVSSEGFLTQPPVADVFFP